MQGINRLIDHTLLKPDAPLSEYERLCAEALEFDFFAVCLPSAMVALAAQQLRGSNIQIASVVGFPLGHSLTKVKCLEAEKCLALGATEIDMVLNMAWLKSGETQMVEQEIAEVVKACAGHAVKVILETSLLADAEKVLACQIAKNAGAAFVKTSTGFAGGATVADVALLHATVGPSMGVKASGGIRTLETAQAMVGAGASRIGTSSGVHFAQGKVPSVTSGY